MEGRRHYFNSSALSSRMAITLASPWFVGGCGSRYGLEEVRVVEGSDEDGIRVLGEWEMALGAGGDEE